jgi:hypothetical protein
LSGNSGRAAMHRAQIHEKLIIS